MKLIAKLYLIFTSRNLDPPFQVREKNAKCLYLFLSHSLKVWFEAARVRDSQKGNTFKGGPERAIPGKEREDLGSRLSVNLRLYQSNKTKQNQAQQPQSQLEKEDLIWYPEQLFTLALWLNYVNFSLKHWI